MSKESEALKNIVKEINAYKLHGLGDGNWMGVQDIMQYVSIIEQALNELERLKKVEKLLNEIKDVVNRPNASYIVELLEQPKRYVEIENLIKELEK